MFKKSLSILLASLLCLGVVSTAYAQKDRQGKTSLETNKSRPKENKPAQTGSQRVQNQTKERTQKALDSTGSARQQEKTKKSVNRIVNKK
jgi:hypothetical protein